MLYWFFFYLLKVLFAIFCRWEVHGKNNFPNKGGLLLAVNHVSYLDPFIAGTAAPRGVYYMARASLMKRPISRWFLKTIHCIPLDIAGAGDISAFKECIRYVSSGRAVLIFPEGTRSHDGQLKAGKLGIGLLAMMGKVDILPCYIHGSYEMFPRHNRLPQPHKVHVYFGPLLRYHKEFGTMKMGKPGYRHISERVMEEISKLRDQAIN
jgi:1-acyl-sn-glycerol-3-phosphate acyltransferase